MIYLLNIFYKLIKIIFFKKTFKNKWDYSYDDPQNRLINWYPLIDNKIATKIFQNSPIGCWTDFKLLFNVKKIHVNTI